MLNYMNHSVSTLAIGQTQNGQAKSLSQGKLIHSVTERVSHLNHIIPLNSECYFSSKHSEVAQPLQVDSHLVSTQVKHSTCYNFKNCFNQNAKLPAEDEK